jgi:hypothetical protein
MLRFDKNERENVGGGGVYIAVSKAAVDSNLVVRNVVAVSVPLVRNTDVRACSILAVGTVLLWRGCVVRGVTYLTWSKALGP